MTCLQRHFEVANAANLLLLLLPLLRPLFFHNNELVYAAFHGYDRVHLQ